jgi:hypothetical protein
MRWRLAHRYDAVEVQAVVEAGLREVNEVARGPRHLAARALGVSSTPPGVHPMARACVSVQSE